MFQHNCIYFGVDVVSQHCASWRPASRDSFGSLSRRGFEVRLLGHRRGKSHSAIHELHDPTHVIQSSCWANLPLAIASWCHWKVGGHWGRMAFQEAGSCLCRCLPNQRNRWWCPLSFFWLHFQFSWSYVLDDQCTLQLIWFFLILLCEINNTVLRIHLFTNMHFFGWASTWAPRWNHPVLH